MLLLYANFRSYTTTITALYCYGVIVKEALHVHLPLLLGYWRLFLERLLLHNLKTALPGTHWPRIEFGVHDYCPLYVPFSQQEEKQFLQLQQQQYFQQHYLVNGLIIVYLVNTYRLQLNFQTNLNKIDLSVKILCYNKSCLIEIWFKLSTSTVSQGHKKTFHL